MGNSSDHQSSIATSSNATTSVNGSGVKDKGIMQNKLEQLSSVLRKANRKGLPDLELHDLAAALFAKAPIQYIKTRSIEELDAISTFCAEALAPVCSASEPLVANYYNKEKYSVISIALGDRPFIVNTITEYFRHQQIQIQHYLHPILVHADKRYSLSYLEIDPVSDIALPEVTARLADALRDLILVTDGYQEMLERTHALSEHLDSTVYAGHFSAESEPSGGAPEIAHLVRWLMDGNFVFLGQARWQVKSGHSLDPAPQAETGMFSSTQEYQKSLQQESFETAQQLLTRGIPFVLEKLRTESTIHRMRHITHLAIQELGPDGKAVAVHSIIGLLTSKAHTQECSTIPLVRLRTAKLLQAEEFIELSHDYKNTVDLIDRMPTEEALRLTLEDLQQLIHIAIRISNQSEIRVHTRVDRDLLDRPKGVSVAIILPRERFTSQLRHSLRESLESILGLRRGATQFHLDLSNKPFSRLYYYAPIESASQIEESTLVALRNEVLTKCRTWQENLETRLRASELLGDHKLIAKRYRKAFAPEYQALVSVDGCEFDIICIESLTEQAPLKVALSYSCMHSSPLVDDDSGDQITAAHSEATSPSSVTSLQESASDRAAANTPFIVPALFSISIYSLHREITVSRAVPLFENVGLEVINEQSLRVQPRDIGDVHISRFLVRSVHNTKINAAAFNSIISPGLTELFDNSVRSRPYNSDPLDSLMLTSSLPLQTIQVLRSYCYLLWQMNKHATRRTVLKTFADHPRCALIFWNIFSTLFNPDLELTLDERKELSAGLREQYRAELRSVSDITRDRILRSLLTLLENTVRTNYFATREDGMVLPIALKLTTEAIEFAPQPKPKFEVYLFSPYMEGIHLRGGSVARGGLRWSDRHEDFRHEVLGLMKTQKIKNVVIVPTGAKGGFIVKNLPSDPAALSAEVERVYSMFIRSLLSISDNRNGEKIVPPKRVLRFDGDDPYLVVAADKGTATFSDLANRIATDEYKFWLGDAFASGGSNGYDHKLYGITARGAWECAKRLFQDAGVNYEIALFTVIGIGDMAGDVFGNGLLMSKHANLIAAFNHSHIFIDPTPDSQSSYEERLRLFRTPRSKWSDYNPALISAGGGVFGRFDKEIVVTPEMRSCLSLPEDTPSLVNGETLVAHILRAKADLLWNGGIGTYVKSSAEAHSQVQDSANDGVRVNADELRVRCVAEGGNLGFTQAARIEFAQKGGFINTDAIDNSGGVDLSDHEVNLKILFAKLVAQSKLSSEERNTVLKQVAAEVVELVLQNNRSQVLLLSIAEKRSRKNIEYFQLLLRYFAKAGLVNRALEKLPDDEEFQDRIGRGQGLTRPELAVCCAITKMWLKELLNSSELLDDPILEPFLIDYFPAVVIQRWRDEALMHPLGKNIIATQIVNSLLDEVGITFVHRMSTLHGTTPLKVVKSWVVAHLILDSRSIKQELRQLDRPDFGTEFKDKRAKLGRVTRRVAEWVLTRSDTDLSLSELMAALSGTIETICEQGEALLNADDKKKYNPAVKAGNDLGLSTKTAQILAYADWIESLLEVARVSKLSGSSFEDVAADFVLINRELLTSPLQSVDTLAPARNKWERELMLGTVEEIKREFVRILLDLRASGATSKEKRSELLRTATGYEGVRGVLEELAGTPIDAAALSVVARHLRQYRIAR